MQRRSRCVCLAPLLSSYPALAFETTANSYRVVSSNMNAMPSIMIHSPLVYTFNPKESKRSTPS